MAKPLFTQGLEPTSAIYTDKVGVRFVIQVDPKAVGGFERFEARFAGLKVVDNARTIEAVVEKLIAQRSSYIIQIGRLSDAGYLFDNSQSETLDGLTIR